MLFVSSTMGKRERGQKKLQNTKAGKQEDEKERKKEKVQEERSEMLIRRRFNGAR